MWKIKQFWNGWDKFAVCAHIVGIICTICGTVFVVWFVVVKAKPLAIKNRLDKENKYEEQCSKARNKAIED